MILYYEAHFQYIELWCLMAPSPIFQLYRDGHIFLLEYPLKTTDLQQVADKTLSHNVVSSASSHELD